MIKETLDLLFPNRCLQCNTIIEGEEIICENCFVQIHFSHDNFDINNSLGAKCRLLFPTENAFALMQFEEDSLSRKLVHQLKYGGKEKIGKILANWTTERLDFKKDTPDLMVTVPLHSKKQKERGYNQLHLFAETLSDLYKIPLDKEVLKRNFYGKAQAKKDKKHRLETQNQFSLIKNVSGKHILIIDDVFTTGNTMASIVWEILKNPGNKVSVLVMAVDI